MAFAEFGPWHWLSLVQYELVLFAGVFFLLGALDDCAVDLTWLWLRFTGRVGTVQIDRSALEGCELEAPAAVLIPAWREDLVIADTIRQILEAWPQAALRLYVGCYRNDPATIECARAAAPSDTRLRIVLHDRDGPTTKGDCLNRLFQAVLDDERLMPQRFKMVVFHDAEDMVDPAALAMLDRAIRSDEPTGKASGSDFVQLPVEPIVQSGRHWLGSHYCEEFAEDHAKTMIVRDALRAGIPSAGVGCAVSRRALDMLQHARSSCSPFASGSLTEDYEMGLSIADLGGRCRFLRVKDSSGRLLASRAYFPSRLNAIVRQKSRWIHGIALQGWDRVGWGVSGLENWMRYRDRRGPLAAILLALGYGLLALAITGWTAELFGYGVSRALPQVAEFLLVANAIAFVWRAFWRFRFVTEIYGAKQGLYAVARIPVTNVIAIMAGHRALWTYMRSLMGEEIRWDKTHHYRHPTYLDQALRPHR